MKPRVYEKLLAKQGSMKRFALIGALLSVFVTAVLYADSLMIDFEAPAYHIGSIDMQNGWGGQNPPGIPINPLIDQAVVTNGSSAPASFGKQSWRISNAYTSGSFGDMPFSPSLANEAGETQAQNGNGVFTFSGGTRQNHFEAQWAFTSADPNGPGTDCSPTGVTCSYLSMAPDRGDGARMSYIRLEDDFSGLRVFFDDYQDKAPYGAYGSPATAAQGCGPEDNFGETMVASGLDRTKAHTVKLTMDFVDGPRNDVVKVYVDGEHVHTGTSWEDYFRWCTESGGGTGTTAHDQSRTVDSMIFTVRGGQGETHPLNRGRGFLIDNLSLLSSTTGCRGGDGDGDFDGNDGHKHHGHFHKDSCEGGSGDVEEDNTDTGQHFQSTSVNSSTFTSDAGSQTLTMIGTGLHSGLPVGFTMIAVDNGGVSPGVFTLILTDGYSVTGSLVNGSLQIY
jgi:hypothetical protein